MQKSMSQMQMVRLPSLNCEAEFFSKRAPYLCCLFSNSCKFSWDFCFGPISSYCLQFHTLVQKFHLSMTQPHFFSKKTFISCVVYCHRSSLPYALNALKTHLTSIDDISQSKSVISDHHGLLVRLGCVLNHPLFGPSFLPKLIHFNLSRLRFAQLRPSLCQWPAANIQTDGF
jgi:hypothetical protein